MMTLENVRIIHFDNEAERRRILAAFEFGPLQDKLLAVLTAFEAKDLNTAASLLKQFKPDEYEYLHYDMTDCIIRHIRNNDGKPPTHQFYRIL